MIDYGVGYDLGSVLHYDGYVSKASVVKTNKTLGIYFEPRRNYPNNWSKLPGELSGVVCTPSGLDDYWTACGPLVCGCETDQHGLLQLWVSQGKVADSMVYSLVYNCSVLFERRIHWSQGGSWIMRQLTVAELFAMPMPGWIRGNTLWQGRQRSFKLWTWGFDCNWGTPNYPSRRGHQVSLCHYSSSWEEGFLPIRHIYFHLLDSLYSRLSWDQIWIRICFNWGQVRFPGFLKLPVYRFCRNFPVNSLSETNRLVVVYKGSLNSRFSLSYRYGKN